MPRIAIIGPGAVGGVMAAWLAKDGRHEVSLCCRTPVESLTVETPEGVLSSRPAVFTDPKAAPAVDWVLVTTKTYDAASAALWFPNLTAQGAPVAVLQNGVEHRERFASYLPADRLIPVIVDCPAERFGPGRILQRRVAKLLVPAEGRGQEFVELFAGTAIEAALTDDFRTAAWRKLCVNSAGVINALLLKPSGVMRDDGVAEVARQLVRECIAVGRAEGAVLGDELVESVIQGYRQGPPESVNSIQADRAAGRPMETDARNGVIVRLGLRHRIPTPCNHMAAVLLGAMAK